MAAAHEDTPCLFWLSSSTVQGYAPVPSGIDLNWLVGPDSPETRYRGASSDRFANAQHNGYRTNGPIVWPTAKSLGAVANNGGAVDANQDSGDGTIWNFAFGGPRWRHNGNTACNVAFADGTVRTLIVTKKTLDTRGGEGFDNEFRRYMLMMKWPQNKKDSYTVISPS